MMRVVERSRRRVRAVLSVLVLAALAACTGPEPPNRDEAAGTPAQSGTASTDIRRGMLVLGHEVRSFTPCDGGEAAWVVDRTSGGELDRVYGELAVAPYQPVFVEVSGAYGPPPAEGFGAEHARQLTVHELRRAALEGPGCGEDARAFELRALGNEPFWSVTVARWGIAWSRPEAPAPIVFPYAPPEISPDGSEVYVSTTELPHFDISLEVHAGPCTDTMSGARYRYTAHVRVDGQEMQGCAYEGLPPSRFLPDHTIRTVERKIRGCGADGSAICAWFRFDYPEIRSGLPSQAHDAIAEAIAAWLARPLAEGREPAPPEELISRWEKDWEEFHDRFPDSAQGRRIERRVSVLDAGETWVSLRMRELSDLGGAHPNETVTLRSYDRGSGAPITIEKLVDPDERDALTRLAETQFRRSKGLAEDTSLADAGYWFEGDRFALGGNFALTEAGLRFRFDAYEIAPYAMGATTFDLPWAVVAPLLRPEEKGRLDLEAPGESLNE